MGATRGRRRRAAGRPRDDFAPLTGLRILRGGCEVGVRGAKSGSGYEVVITRSGSGQPFCSVVAPVMMATASVGVCDFGVITPAQPPSRAMWIRSDTSNTFGMLWLIKITGSPLALIS